MTSVSNEHYYLNLTEWIKRMKQESSITSDMTTLMLAWQLARVDGLSQAAAIRKCARKLRGTTKDVKMFNLMTSINKCNDDSRVVDCLDKLADKLEQDGLMFS